MKTRMVVWLALLALFAAACATENAPVADDPEADDTPAATEGGTDAAAGDVECPIKIGASLSQTGDYARIAADQQAAYELFVEQLNEQDGLLGCDVELVVYDDASTPETGARLYERLITEDKVDLVMGPYSSAVTGGMMPIVERYEMVNVAPMASADELFQQGLQYSFQVITPASKYLEGALEIMKEEGLRTIAYIGEDSAFPGAVQAALESGQESGDYELVFSQLYPKGTTDFSSLITQIGEAKPDAIFGGTYAQDAIAITNQLAEQRVNAPIIALTVGAAENEYAEAVGAAAELMMGASHWEPALETPGNAEFVEAYNEATGKEPGYHAAGSYAGMQVLIEAVRACECLDQARIREELVALETETVFGPFDVDDSGAQVAKTGFVIQWMDGKKEIVKPDDNATAEYVVPHPPWN